MQLLDMVKGYKDLLDEKDRLAELVKANNLAIEVAKQNIAEQMVDEDCPRISTGGYTFSLTPKTAYSKRSDAELAERGVVFFDVLREEGLGDLIVETVNARTLQAAVKNYVEENGELSEGLDSIIKAYEFNDITRRKETRRG